MDMKPLVEGECGNSNPLMRVAQHFTQPQDIFGSKFQNESGHISEKWAEELLRNTNNSNMQNLNDANRFKMDSLLQSVENIQNQRMNQLPVTSNTAFDNNLSNIWTNEFLRENQNLKVDDFFGSSDKYLNKSNLDNSKWAEEYLEKSSYEMMISGNNMFDSFSNASSQQNNIDLLKNNEKNIWSNNYLDNTKTEIITSAANNKAINRSNIGHNFMNAIQNDLQNKNVANRFSTFTNSMLFDAQLNSEQTEIIDDKQQEELPGIEELLDEKKDEDVEDFVVDPKRKVSYSEDENGFWARLAREFQKNMELNGQYVETEDTELVDDSPEHNLLETEIEADLKKEQEQNEDYQFAPDSDYDEIKDLPDHFEEGLRRLKEGDLPGAVKCFELACKNEPGNAKYWQYLGTTQASNEHDLVAIKALKKCIAIEPGNLTALMALAVCYTNESMHQEACKTLKEWMLNNSKYNSVLEFSKDEFNDQSLNASYAKQNLIISSMSREKFDKVKDMFITAARLYPYEPDAEVQCGLGVLFNISGEYDKAIDCFKCALTVKKDDPSLWNRLGATLANGSKSEEAVAAYRRALELNPGFIRTRYNLGIICVHLGVYREAVEHFLTVLNLQNLTTKDKTPGNLLINRKQVMSDNVWNSLKFVVSMMKRHDLYAKLDERDLDYFNQQFSMEF